MFKLFRKKDKKVQEATNKNLIPTLNNEKGEGQKKDPYTIAKYYRYGWGVSVNYDLAIKWYKRAVDSGNVEASNDMGIMYRDGEGVTKNMYTAIDWFRKAANQEHAIAQYNLASIYENNLKDIEKARFWYQKAAAKGNEAAQEEVNRLNTEGYNVENAKKENQQAVKIKSNKSHTEPTNILLSALKKHAIGLTEEEIEKAKDNDGDTLYKIGLLYYNMKRYSNAFKWFRIGAAQNHSGAQFYIGFMYRHGYCVSKDHNTAMEWFQKAASNGNDMAQYNIGICYLYGWAAPIDYTQVMYWFTKAADNGNLDALNDIGTLYRDGKGVTKNNYTAIEWFTKAANQQHATAQYNLGSMYENTKDIGQAIYWYRKASKNGNEPAKEEVKRLKKRRQPKDKNEEQNQRKETSIVTSSKTRSASDNATILMLKRDRIELTEKELEMTIKNDGDTLCKIARSYRRKRDLTKAFQWYNKAALQNHTEAQFLVGYMYHYGDGVSKNYKSAMDWYQKAASAGNTNAMMSIAELYRSGLGQFVSIYAALKWYMKAANNGNRDASYELGEIYEFNNSVQDLQRAIEWYQKAADQDHEKAKISVQRLNELGYHSKEELNKNSSNVSTNSEPIPPSRLVDEQHVENEENLKRLIDDLQSKLGSMEMKFEESKDCLQKRNEMLEEEKTQKDEEIRLLRERLAKIETPLEDGNDINYDTSDNESVHNSTEDAVENHTTNINQMAPNDYIVEDNADLNYDSDDTSVDLNYDSDTSLADPNYDSSDNEDRANDINYD